MALFALDPFERSYAHPMERCVSRILGHAFDDLARSVRTVAPYWLDLPAVEECNVGNTVGKVIVDKDKFGVEVNVKQFRPEELSVNVRDRELVLEGHHEERADNSGRIERHFIRKYTIPDDVQLETLQSHLSDDGILTVTAKKAAIEGPPARNIPIKAAPKENDGKKGAKESGQGYNLRSGGKKAAEASNQNGA